MVLICSIHISVYEHASMHTSTVTVVGMNRMIDDICMKCLFAVATDL